MEAVEEGEDTNHIMVLPSNGATNQAAGEGGGGGEQGAEKPGFQRPKPRMQVEIRQAQNKTFYRKILSTFGKGLPTDWVYEV